MVRMEFCRVSRGCLSFPYLMEGVWLVPVLGAEDRDESVTIEAEGFDIPHGTLVLYKKSDQASEVRRMRNQNQARCASDIQEEAGFHVEAVAAFAAGMWTRIVEIVEVESEIE